MKTRITKAEIVSYLLLPIGFAFHLFMLFSRYRGETAGDFALMIASDVLLFVLIYYFLVTWQYNKNKKEVKHLTEVMIEQAANMDSNIKMLNADPEYAEFYDALAKIFDDIRSKDRARQEILDIVNSVAMNMEFDKLLEELLPKLITVTRSNCCAFYTANHYTNKLEIKQSLGFGKNIYAEFDLSIGEGFVGMAATSKNVTVINDIPNDTVYVIRSILGKIKPKSMMMAPITNQDQLQGMLVFASINNYSDDEISMVELVKYYVGVAVSNGIAYERTKRLTNELKFQNKLIQDMNEELEKKVMDRTLFLNNIIDSIKDYAIYAMDKNGVLLTWNEGAEILMGYTKAEVLGRHVEALYSRDEAEIVQRRMELALREGKYIENGLRIKKDGSEYYYEMMLFCMYNENNEVIGLSNITRDITAMKSVENALWYEREALQRVIDRSSRAMIIIDSEGNIQLANNNAKLLLENEQIAGRGIYEFFEEWKEMYERLIEGGPNLSAGEWRYSLRNTDDMVNITLNPLNGDNGKIVKIILYLYKEVRMHEG